MVAKDSSDASVNTSGSNMREFTEEEVAQHNSSESLFVIIDGRVYDLTSFVDLHPGGAAVLLSADVAGLDATNAFYGLHRAELLARPNYARLAVGVLKGATSVVRLRSSGENSRVPFAEPGWLVEGFRSPYFTETHRTFQHAMRKFADEVIRPDALAREADGKPPSRNVLDGLTALNVHAMRLGPGSHLQGLKLMNGLVEPAEFNYFHEMIIHQELARAGPGTRGYTDGLLTGLVIGLTPVLNFGCDAVKREVVPEVINGRKFICLAITEAFAGSDVGGLKCHAVKTPDGKHWIVNGTKKWITNGTFADYFTVGCLTGPPAEKAFTVILIPRTEGVSTRPIRTSYSPSAGTAYITFDNVRVPVENTLGKEGGGLFVILSNFNHERWSMACATSATTRMVIEECLKWSNQRTVFGQPLNAQPVVRNRLASMIARLESYQNWLENITYQMCHMSYKEQADKLAGPIALLKMFGTKCAQETARDAVQIFGGRGITEGGMGRIIENFHRTAAFDAVLGGAEDVLGDLGVRQVMRQMPSDARL